MDIRKVKKLIELLENSSVDEIEIHEGGGIGAGHTAPGGSFRPGTSLPRGAGRRAPRGHACACRELRRRAPRRITGSESGDQLPPGYVVTSPMVGMFYQASSPGSKPFVTIGQRVAPGDTLCIIEAMKILNQNRVGGCRGGKGDHRRERAPRWSTASRCS